MDLLIKANKTGAPKKYTDNREFFKTGDLVLYKGTSFLSKSIQYFDKAYYNHVGVVWKVDNLDRVLTLDMWKEGLACLPLSRRMDGYSDFCVIRPNVSEDKIESAIKEVLSTWDGRDVKYDMSILLRVAFIKKTGIDITGLGEKDKFICSEFAQYYCDLLGLDTYKGKKLITPEDFRRYMDGNFTKFFDEAPAPDMSYKGRKIMGKYEL